MKLSPENTEQPMLNENIQQLFWRLSIPSILGLLIFGLNNFVDAVYVGNLLNADALAGVTFSYPFAQMITGLASLIGMGGAACLSLYIGKNAKCEIQRLLNNVIFIGIIVGTIASVLLNVFADELISSVGATGISYQYGYDYLFTLSFGVIFTVLGFGLNVFIRSEGNMMIPMILFSLGLMTNIVLTPVLILQFDMGVAGAAHATNISMFVAFIANYLYFLLPVKRRFYRPDNIEIKPALIFKIIGMGAPGFFLYLFILIQQFVVIKFLMHYGDATDVAYFGAASRVMMLCIVPVYGMSRALQPIVGINYGAGARQRCFEAFKIFNYWGFLLNLILLMIIGIYATNTLHLIVPELEISGQNAGDFLVYITTIIFQPMLIFTMVYYQSIGQARIASGIILLRQLALFIPVAFVMAYFYHVSGLYYTFFIVDLILAVFSYIVIRKSQQNNDIAVNMQTVTQVRS